MADHSDASGLSNGVEGSRPNELDDAGPVSTDATGSDEPDVPDLRQGRIDARDRVSLNREAVVHEREVAVNLREEVARLREEIVTVREQASRDLDRLTGELSTRNDELREVNQHLVKATFDARALAAAAEDMHRQQERFLAMLAHELRNPLAPIHAAASVIDRIASSDPLLPWVHEVLERQVVQMAHLLDDLLDASRITHGKITLQRRPVAVTEFVEVAVDTCRALVEERQHELTLILPDVPVYINGDPVRLAQMLGNLLLNAAKYTDAGGRITLEVQVEDGMVALHVRDTGRGIAADALPVIFDLFSQGDVSLSRSQGGLGIGLAVVQTMAELHGGTVQASSGGTGTGSQFVIRLPQMAQVVEETVPLSASAVPVPPGQSRRVLLIDDNEDLANTLAKLLEMVGHRVTTLGDGLTAVDRIREEAPDVVVCDIGLPGLDGYAVAERVCAEMGERRPVLIAITGYGQPEDRSQALSAGFDYHLVKPAELEVIQELVQAGRRGRPD